VLPQTQFVESDGHFIAYQVIGDGPDVLFVPGLVSHLDLQWSDPWFASALRRLASFSRLIIFDHRGIGLSDPAKGVPRLQQRVDDMRAVLDAVGSSHAALLGHCNGGPASLLFSVTHPERVSSLVICSSFAKGRPDAAHPGALSAQTLERARDAVDHWGEGRSLRLFTRSTAGGPWHARMYGIFERAASSRAMARAALASTLEIDVTDVLPAVRVPTLVMHCREDYMLVEAARYIAQQVPGARFVEIAGPDHMPFAGTRSGEFLHVIEEFVTGRRSPDTTGERVLTVLFTDVVGSTEHTRRLGDRAWRDLIERHDMLVRNEVERFDGRSVKTIGDGVLAVFDGPERAVRAAAGIRDTVGELGLRVRAGLHTGPCELSGDDVIGLTVNIAARIAACAGPGELLVSDVVRKLSAGSTLSFTPSVARTLKGIAGRWQLSAAGTDDASGEFARTWTSNDESPQADMRVRDHVVVRAARITPWLTRSAIRLVSSHAAGERRDARLLASRVSSSR
jgi:class 3 adenylate cyclase